MALQEIGQNSGFFQLFYPICYSAALSASGNRGFTELDWAK